MAEPYTGTVLPLDGGDKPPPKQPYTGPVLPTQPAYEAPYQGLHDKPYAHPLEFPDAPTTGHMPLPGIALHNGKDIEGNPGVSIGAKASTLFGTLMTDSPQARAEIYEKNLPGAKATKDKYGNPMIEYQGKKYYTARPGEFDAMDAGRVAAGVSATLPAIALAPESVLGASVASGVAAGAQSLGEDALTQAAGGTSQNIDATKAGLSAVVATLVPLGLGKAVLPLAGKLFAFARSGTPLTDEALTKLGFTASQISSLTPELRDRISTVARQTFGNSQAAGSAYRRGLSKEFNTDLTRGEISGNPGQISKEQTLTAPGAVPGSGFSRQTMLENRGAQDAQLSDAQLALRAQAGGGAPLKPEQAGQVLKQGFDNADQAAKAKVDQLYGVARDPFAIEAAGGRPSVPPTVTGSLNQVVRSDLAKDNVGRIALGSEASNLTPNAAAALGAVDKWSKSTMGPRAGLSAGQMQPSLTSSPGVSVYRPQGLLAGEELPPGASVNRMAIDQPGVRVTAPPQGPSAEASLAAQTAPTAPPGPRMTGPSPTGQIAGDVNWSKVEDLRQALVGYEEAAVASGNKQDIAAVQQIKKSFDDQFGPLNPLLQPARDAHAERMSTFKPGGSADQDKATKTALQLLQGPEGGAKVVNTIFGSGMKTGEAAQMLDHLNTQVFPTQPAAREVIKEQALRRLVVDPEGNPLSPQKTVTALDKALGDREGPLYDKLFTPDEMARLRRFRELQDTIAKSRTPINPPGSGTIILDYLKHAVGGGIGGTIGYKLGSMVGMPEAGATVGGAIGAAARTAAQRIQAARAINPPANYGTQGLLGAPAMGAGQAAGQANQQQPGPVDRLWQGLLGP